MTDAPMFAPNGRPLTGAAPPAGAVSHSPNGKPTPATITAAPEQPTGAYSVSGRPLAAPGVDAATMGALESFQLAPEATAVSYGTPWPLTEESIPHDTNARGWLAAGSFPKEVGSALLKTFHEAEQNRAGKPLTDGERELSKSSAVSKLQRALGAEFEAKIDLAQRLAQRIEKARPGFLQWLVDSGAGNDPMLIAQMAHQAEMLKLRGPL